MIDDPLPLLSSARDYTRVTAQNRKLMETVMLAKLASLDPATLVTQADDWLRIFPQQRDRAYITALGAGQMPVELGALRLIPADEVPAARDYLMTGLIDDGLAAPSPITDPLEEILEDEDFELIPPADYNLMELYFLTEMAGIEPEDLRARAAEWIRMFPADRQFVMLATLANVTGGAIPNINAVTNLSETVLDSIRAYLLSSIFRCYDSAQGTYFDVNSTPSNIVFRWNYIDPNPEKQTVINWLVYKKKQEDGGGSYVTTQDYTLVATLAPSARSYLDPQTIGSGNGDLWSYKVAPTLQRKDEAPRVGPFLKEGSVATFFRTFDSAVAGTPITHPTLGLAFGPVTAIKGYWGPWSKNNGIYLPNLRYINNLPTFGFTLGLAYGTRGQSNEYSAFQTANFPTLLKCGDIQAFSSTLVKFLAPQLQTAARIWLQSSWMSQVDLTALTQCDSIVIAFNIAANAPPFNSYPMLRVMNLPNLTTVVALTTYDFQFAAEGAALNFRGFGSADIRHPTLTSFRFPKFVFKNSQQFNIHGNELGADSVDHILERAYNSPGLTLAIITITDPTNPNGYDDLNAPPSEVGWKYKVALVAAGNTVKTRDVTFFPDPSKFVWTARNSGGNTLLTLQSYSGPVYFAGKISYKVGPWGNVGANTGSTLLSALPLTDFISIPGNDAVFDWQVAWLDQFDTQAGLFCPLQTRSDIIPLRIDLGSTPNNIILSWSAYGGAASYNIYRKKHGDKTGFFNQSYTLWRSVSAQTTTDTDGLPQHQNWTYRLNPVVSGSEVSTFAEAGVCRQFLPDSDSFFAATMEPLVQMVFENLDLTTSGDNVANPIYIGSTLTMQRLLKVTGNLLLKPRVNNEPLTSINLPLLQSIGSILSVSGLATLNTFTIPSLVFANGQAIYAGDSPLTQASVDAILARGALGSTCKGGFFQLATSASGGGPCAGPSGTGFGYKQTLVGRKNTVWTQLIF